MTEIISGREFGRLEQKVTNLERMMEDLASQLAQTSKQIDELKDIVEQARGGWRVILLVGGIAASITTVFIKYASVMFN